MQFIKDDLHHPGIFAAGAIGSNYYRKSLVFPAPASNAGETSNASNAVKTVIPPNTDLGPAKFFINAL